MENNLAELIETIKKKRELANSSPGEDRTSYNVRLGKIKRAKEDLKQLFLDYRRSIQESSAFILVTGTNAEKFASTSEEDFACFSLDAEDFYKDLIEKVPPRLYTDYSSSPAVFDYISAHFGDRALEIGIIGHSPLLFESKYKKKLNGKDDLLKLLKVAFNEKVGSEVVGLDAIDKVATKAIEREYDGKVVPIVMFSTDEELIKELSKGFKKVSGNVFIVSAGEVSDSIKDNSVSHMDEVSEKSVEESLTEIRKNLN